MRGMSKDTVMRPRVGEHAVDSPLPTQRSNEAGRAIGDSRHTDSGVEEQARCCCVGENECCGCISFLVPEPSHCRPSKRPKIWGEGAGGQRDKRVAYGLVEQRRLI